jgi:toxin-antitoxin system PIN domain toxin
VLILDINVLVNAYHREAPNHEEMKAWLEELIASGEAFGFPDFVLFNFVRVVTLPRPWKVPGTLEGALSFCQSLRGVRRCELIHGSEHDWARFETLSRRVGATGNLIHDVYLAALALERSAELITDDSDFEKFPGLRWRRPLAASGQTNPS